MTPSPYGALSDELEGRKLTKVQLAMLEASSSKGADGVMCHDGIEAGVASRLAKMGLVTLPAAHGFYFSPMLRVRATEKGRALLAALRSLQTGDAK